MSVAMGRVLRLRRRRRRKNVTSRIALKGTAFRVVHTQGVSDAAFAAAFALILRLWSGTMASSEDTEITLGTGKLLVLFFGLVAICALFFALGYSLGRKSEPILAAAPAVQAAPPSRTSNSATPAASPMTFYKNVEQKDASAELTPATDTKTDAPAAPTNAAATQPATAGSQAAAANSDAPSTVLPTSAYFVQVAAVTKQEDADALVDALKKKDYPAFIAPQSKMDSFFHVQVGPYSDVKDAEAMRTRLVADGYSPILKK